jgi:hypothetical protein
MESAFVIHGCALIFLCLGAGEGIAASAWRAVSNRILVWAEVSRQADRVG